VRGACLPSVVGMITNVSLVSVWVKDQDASLAFYTDVLGFEVGEDIRLAEDFRWLTVVHPSQPELALHLTTPGPPLSEELQAAIGRALDAGGMPGIGVTVDDCRATHADLVAKGVTFLQEPAERPYGVEALLRDNSGNWIVMVEHRDFDPSTLTRDQIESPDPGAS
jgi:catechol 2,3-dioxygenase-like lactoylglutathione lyase family enzyme